MPRLLLLTPMMLLKDWQRDNHGLVATSADGKMASITGTDARGEYAGKFSLFACYRLIPQYFFFGFK
jgi:hypothetical protein